MPKTQPTGVGMKPSATASGAFVRERRLKLKLSQVQLNRLIPRSGPTNHLISRIEIGARRFLAPDQLKALADALQVPLEELRQHLPTRAKEIAQPKTALGKLIRSRREELGLSLPVFAQKMGVKLTRAENLELRQGAINYSTAPLLAGALQLDPSVFAPFLGTIQGKGDSKLGALVRDRRRELGMSGEALAKKLDVSGQFVGQIETGLSPLTQNNGFIERLAAALKLEVHQLEVVRPVRRRTGVGIANPLSDFLATRRLQLRLSQRQLASMMEIDHYLISRIERGLAHVTPDLLSRFERALDCQVPPDLVPPKRRKKPPH